MYLYCKLHLSIYICFARQTYLQPSCQSLQTAEICKFLRAKSCSDYMFITSLSYWEVDCVVVELRSMPSQQQAAIFRVCVVTFVSLKQLDVYKETSESRCFKPKRDFFQTLAKQFSVPEPTQSITKCCHNTVVARKHTLNTFIMAIGSHICSLNHHGIWLK